MNKIKIIILLILLLFLFSSTSAMAQCAETLDEFAEIQKALAGEPSEWRFRQTMPTSGFYYHTLIDPADVLATEDAARLRPNTVDTNPDEEGQGAIEFFKMYFDEESGKMGSFIRFLAGGTQFSGNYKLQSDKTTELEIIKDIYEQITKRVARFGVPSNDSPSACLSENTGQCRHMATILQESLEEYGIKSEQIFSPTHTWVRVTLSDPKYANNLFAQFDLDPTWYAQPIPLPPRNGIWISDAWKKAMTACVPSGTPTITPTPSISPTPTPTFTPTPTPSISVTPKPTTPDEDNSNNSGSSNYNNDGDGVLWTVPR